MLTALSVAHDCSMIDVNDTVVHMTVLPPSDSRPPHIEYTYTAVTKPEAVSWWLYICNKYALQLFKKFNLNYALFSTFLLFVFTGNAVSY